MENGQTIWDVVIGFIISYKFYVPVLTFCFSLVFIRSSKKVVEKLINKEAKSLEAKKKNTMIKLIENLIKYMIYVIALIIILSTWGINVSGIITGLGVVGVVGGLALQDALKDIIMGCNILMDNYFIVGDLVTYNGFTGEVIEFNLKSTKIKSVTGVVKVVANRNISEIENLSQKDATVVITVPTSYDAKAEKIEKVIDDIAAEIDGWSMTTKKTDIDGVDNLNSSSVDYQIRVHCTASNRYAMKRKVLALVKKEFDKNKLEIPFTQVVVHNG